MHVGKESEMKDLIGHQAAEVAIIMTALGITASAINK
jgi:hypothetical protein